MPEPQTEPAHATIHDVPPPLSCTAALTHHWLVRPRGGEKVLAALAELVPDADIFTLVYDRRGTDSTPIAGRRIHTSWLQKLPGATRHYPKLLPLLPGAARGMKLPPVDLVICSDAAVAKGMTPDPRSRVVCYCHSPMRYVYEPEISREYQRTLPAVLRPFWGIVTRRVCQADQDAARRVDVFVANSRHVAVRIARCYGRESVIVHPPVDLPARPACGPRDEFYLCVGFHTRYKRLDLAIDACRALGRRLVVIGEGPETRLVHPRRDAHVTLLGWQSEDVIADHYRRAAGLLFPGEEDFGIVPVEAMAHGCPVVAYGVGGATETVLPGRTGIWFERQTVDCLGDAIRQAEAATFDSEFMHGHAQQFSKARFLRGMHRVFVEVLGQG